MKYNMEALSKGTRGFTTPVSALASPYAQHFTLAGMVDGVGGQPLLARVVGPPGAMARLAAHTGATEAALREELELFGRLQHFNLVRLVATCPDPLAAVMVRAPGGAVTLEARLLKRAGHPPLTLAERLRAGAEVADALAYLHRFGFTHRGVSTANVMWTPAQGECVLGEYGFCRAGTPPELRRQLYPAGGLGYVCPRYTLDGAVTPATDVYAFGVVLWELLTGWPALDRKQGGLVQDRVERLVLPRLAAAGILPGGLLGLGVPLGQLFDAGGPGAGRDLFSCHVLPAVDADLRRHRAAPVCLPALFDLARLAAMCCDPAPVRRPCMYNGGGGGDTALAQMLACQARLPVYLDPEAPVYCIVCHVQLVSSRLSPCGHVCVCRDCAASIEFGAPCPLCGVAVEVVQRIFS